MKIITSILDYAESYCISMYDAKIILKERYPEYDFSTADKSFTKEMQDRITEDSFYYPDEPVYISLGQLNQSIKLIWPHIHDTSIACRRLSTTDANYFRSRIWEHKKDESVAWLLLSLDKLARSKSPKAEELLDIFYLAKSSQTYNYIVGLMCANECYGMKKENAKYYFESALKNSKNYSPLILAYMRTVLNGNEPNKFDIAIEFAEKNKFTKVRDNISLLVTSMLMDVTGEGRETFSDKDKAKMYAMSCVNFISEENLQDEKAKFIKAKALYHLEQKVDYEDLRSELRVQQYDTMAKWHKRMTGDCTISENDARCFIEQYFGALYHGKISKDITLKEAFCDGYQYAYNYLISDTTKPPHQISRLWQAIEGVLKAEFLDKFKDYIKKNDASALNQWQPYNLGSIRFVLAQNPNDLKPKTQYTSDDIKLRNKFFNSLAGVSDNEARGENWVSYFDNIADLIKILVGDGFRNDGSHLDYNPEVFNKENAEKIFNLIFPENPKDSCIVKFYDDIENISKAGKRIRANGKPTSMQSNTSPEPKQKGGESPYDYVGRHLFAVSSEHKEFRGIYFSPNKSKGNEFREALDNYEGANKERRLYVQCSTSQYTDKEKIKAFLKFAETGQVKHINELITKLKNATT